MKSTLVDRISAIAAGQRTHTEARRTEFLSMLRDHRQSETVRLEPFERLTSREREVLELVVKGQQYRQIAAALGISPRTVEVHRARLMEKLGVRNISELVRLSLGGSR